MKPYNKDSRGFTLIEVIVTLLLVGIMAVVAGLGIVQATKAFIFTKEATILGQKGDLAMSRLRRSIQNQTSIDLTNGNPSATYLAVQRLDKGVYVTESYNFSSSDSVLNLTLNSSNPLNAKKLTDSVQTFALSYTHRDGTVWTPAKGIDQLATVNVSTTLTGPGGAVITYVDKIVPRNTYQPKGTFNATAAALGGFNCFVATVAYGNGDYPAVKVLRQFRDRVLVKYSIGRAFIKWYYRIGPDLADSFKSSDFWRATVRIGLMPFVGISFLILYFPAGILLLLLMTWLLARLVIKSAGMQIFFQQRPHWRGVRSQKGSLLVSLIVTMVIMASLGGAMLSMFSAANAASIPAHFSQRAYYLAESGRNYAFKMFLANKDSDLNFINALYSGSTSKTFPVGTDSFKVNVKTFYFNGDAGDTATLIASKWGGFSDNWLSSLTGKQGALQVTTASSTAIRSFTGVTYNSVTGNLEFVLDSAVTRIAGRVMPVVKLNGIHTIAAKNIGDPAGGNDINIGNINTGGGFMLPRVNGTLSFVAPNPFTGVSDTWYILYDKLVEDSGTHNAILQGIRNYPGKTPIPTAGISLASTSPLVLGRYAQITSTGTVGAGAMAIAQTITQNQPLDVVKLYTTVGGAFDPLRAILGNYTTVTEDGAPATKITQTAQTFSYVGSTPTYMQESFQAVSWPASNPMKALWEASDHILSYDVQTKIKFTEVEDDTSVNAVNHPGNYMPGLAFRVKCTPGTTNKDCTYYGVSFVRGIGGRAYHQTQAPDQWGNGEKGYNTEQDDISDSLFAQYASNAGTRPNASDIKCTGADKFVPNFWDSINPTQSGNASDDVILTGGAALDGIPYIMIWQKDWSTAPTSGCGGGGESSPWDWLAFMPLVDGVVQKAYHYKVLGTRPDGWYQGQITGDPRNGTTDCEGPWTIWKLKDKYGVLKTSTVEGVTTLGIPGVLIIRDATTATSTTAGTPVNKFKSVVTPVGWILPQVADATYGSISAEDYQSFKAQINYRIYPKPWITLSAKIVEMVGDFDCNAANGQERINAVMAYVSSTDGVAGTYGASTKDGIRRAYPRNTLYPDTAAYTVRWPDTDDYFTTVVWGGGNYTSKYAVKPANNCGWADVNTKIVEKGKDSDNDSVIAYTSFLTTGATDYFTANDIPEFGYHTAGISAATGCVSPHCETVYFTDGYWQAYKGGFAGMLPGIQQQ